MTPALYADLVARIGAQQAIRELKWMRQAVNPHSSLPDMLARRISGEPLQYILGSQPFGPLNLLARPPVLIPRPETEDWVIRLAERLSLTPQRPQRLVDLGTGSGCIPLLLCHLCPPGSLHALGIDISPHAIKLATDNAALCGTTLVRNKSPRNTFKAIQADFTSPSFLDDQRMRLPFDIVTSNPPYISAEDYRKLPSSVSSHEDRGALYGGPSGLDFYHAIARLIRVDGFVRHGSLMALEVGYGQANAVDKIIRTSHRVRSTEIWSDPWGVERTVIASF